MPDAIGGGQQVQQFLVVRAENVQAFLAAERLALQNPVGQVVPTAGPRLGNVRQAGRNDGHGWRRNRDEAGNDPMSLYTIPSRRTSGRA